MILGPQKHKNPQRFHVATMESVLLVIIHPDPTISLQCQHGARKLRIARRKQQRETSDTLLFQ